MAFRAALRPRSGHGLGEAAVLVVVLAWASNFSLVKFAVDQGNAPGFILVRVLAALVALLPVWAFSARRQPFEWRDLPAFGLLAATGHAGFQLGYIFGTEASSATSATLILALTPAAIAVMSWTTKQEPFHRLTAVGLGLSLVGITLVAGAQSDFSARIGNAGLFAAMLGWAVYTVWSGRLVRKYGAVRVTLWSMSIGLVFLVLPVGLLTTPEDFRGLSVTWWAAAVVSGAGSITLAHLLWGYATVRLGPTYTGVCSNLVPIPALLITWLWLAEPLGGMRFVGAVLIVGGVALARVRRVGPGGKIGRRVPA